MGKVVYSKTFTKDDAMDLGAALIATADLYPLTFVTERDFFPLVVKYLRGRVPTLRAEARITAKGRIAFRLGGNNPTWLELAVQARAYADKNHPKLKMPGYQRNSLLASQNRAELRKLMTEPKGKTRFLLLVDLNGQYDLSGLEADYRDEANKNIGGKTVRIVYTSRRRTLNFCASG
jgi:hypothetical protein